MFNSSISYNPNNSLYSVQSFYYENSPYYVNKRYIYETPETTYTTDEDYQDLGNYYYSQYLNDDSYRYYNTYDYYRNQINQKCRQLPCRTWISTGTLILTLSSLFLHSFFTHLKRFNSNYLSRNMSI